MNRGVNVGRSNGLEPEGASNALAQWWKPLKADSALCIYGAQRHGICGVGQRHVYLRHSWGNFTPLVSLAIHCTVSGAHSDLAPHEGIFRGHDSLINHSLAGSRIPDTKKVEHRHAAGYAFNLRGVLLVLPLLRSLRIMGCVKQCLPVIV